MYGFKLSDIDMTAYFGEDLKLVEDMTLARRFKSTKKSGSPQDWLNLINNDPDLNQGYKFHLVPVIS